MTKREVEKYLKEKGLFENPIIKKIGQGNNSDVFYIKDEKKEYTLRKQKIKFIKESKLLNHYVSLKFLESEKINFAPRAIMYDKNREILLTTYLPGKPINNIRLTKYQIELLISQVVKINQLSFFKYKKICDKNKFKIEYPLKPMESLKIFGINRLKNAIKHKLDKKIIKWIEPRLKDSVNLTKSVKFNKKDIIFAHADLTGANIIKYKQKVFFIDWENTRFFYSRDQGLSYMLLHYEYFLGIKDKLISICARKAKINKKILNDMVNLKMKVIKINDVIWAAEKYALMHYDNIRGWKKYKKITYDGTKEYEKMFE